MKTKMMLGALIASGVLAACGSSKPMTGSASIGRVDGAGVSIQHIAFDPASLEIEAGTNVTWTNKDADVFHTITSGKPGDKGVPGVDEGRPDQPDGLFDGTVEGDGASFEFTFEEAGTYDYFCTVHPVMTGTVIVE